MESGIGLDRKLVHLHIESLGEVLRSLLCSKRKEKALAKCQGRLENRA